MTTEATKANRHDYLSAFYTYARGCFKAAADAMEILALTHAVASTEHGERELFKRNGTQWVESLSVSDEHGML